MAAAPADIYIAIGSNIAPGLNVPAAIEHLMRLATPIDVSTFYRTRPLARPGQEDFRNGMVRMRAPLEREEIQRDLLKRIEDRVGRVRSEDKHAPRTIDLDLAVYGEDGKALWADPEVFVRNFIATPLAELAPALLLPNGATAAANAQALGVEGLTADPELTRKLKHLAR